MKNTKKKSLTYTPTSPQFSSYTVCERDLGTGKFDAQSCCALFTETGRWPKGARETCLSSNKQRIGGRKQKNKKSTAPSTAVGNFMSIPRNTADIQKIHTQNDKDLEREKREPRAKIKKRRIR